MFKTSKDYKLYPIKLHDKIKEADDAYSFIFSMPEEMNWVEGSHVHLALDRFNESIGWFEKKDLRHLSLVSLPEENHIKFTTRIYKENSVFKDGLFSAKEGDTFYLFKIRNRMWLRRDNKAITLLSSGVSISTFRPLLYRFVKDPDHIKEIHSINVDSGHFVFAGEMMQYEQNSEHLTIEYTSHRDLFYMRLEKRLKKQDARDGYFYIVGSDEFIKEVARTLLKEGIPSECIIFDKKPEEIKSLLTDNHM